MIGARTSIAALAVSCAFVACSDREKPAPPAAAATSAPHRKSATIPPTAAAAKDIIAASSDFGELEFTNAAITIPMSKTAMNAPASANAKALIAAGWIRLEGDHVVLAKAAGDPRFVVRPNGFVDVVPVAKKEIGNVAAIRSTPEGIDADFEWTWVPTAIGDVFAKTTAKDLFAKTHRATATLIPDGDRWMLLRIRAAG